MTFIFSRFIDRMQPELMEGKGHDQMLVPGKFCKGIERIYRWIRARHTRNETQGPAGNDAKMENEGLCYCCDKKVVFRADNTWLRDHYVCSNCGCIPRERALMYCIETFYPAWRDCSIHESSPCGRGASLKLKRQCKKYLATQYFPKKPLGAKVGGFENVDLENQPFEDETFDYVITQDVMEHIFDPARAFGEIARTLKKGGAHIFTVPLVNKERPTEKWAEMREGTVRFLREPEYHGNPIDPEGSPVAMHWGYDICDFIFRSSGLYTTVIMIDNLDLGIRAEYIEVLISKKMR
jgi:Methyltransferase domain